METERKTAFITGGSRGIGRAIARRLAKDGFNIVINYSKSDRSAEEVVREVKEYGVEAMAIKCDVSKYDEVEKAIDKIVEEFGSIDVVVNNAGITKDNLILKMDESEWDQVIDVNLKGTFNVIKFASKYMIKREKGR